LQDKRKTNNYQNLLVIFGNILHFITKTKEKPLLIRGFYIFKVSLHLCLKQGQLPKVKAKAQTELRIRPWIPVSLNMRLQ
jgi:hypothetical protein